MKCGPIASLAMAAAALGGCASNLSGLGGGEHYACKAPEGAKCTSVSGVYANTVQGTPVAPKPAEHTRPVISAPSPDSAVDAPAASPRAAPAGSIRTNPRVLRLWIAPWEDADGDLHEEALVHVVVDTGRWLIEHVRPVGRSRVDGVMPPATPPTAPSTEGQPIDSSPVPTRFPVPPGGPYSNSKPSPTER